MLPIDYCSFVGVFCVLSGFIASMITDNRYIGMLIAVILCAVLWVFGIVRAMQDVNFFDVIYVKLFKLPTSTEYEP